MLFKTGERVEAVKDCGFVLTGMTGKVVLSNIKTIDPVGVQWDEPLEKSHTCYNSCKKNGYFVDQYSLKTTKG